MANSFSEKHYQGPEGAIPEKEGFAAERPEIIELKERVEKIESQLKEERVPEEREKMVKREIKTYLEKLQKLPPSAPPLAVRDEAKELSKFPSTQQVGALVSLVFEEGLRQAISVAQALQNPAILDEFHDILVDRYYKILVEKGILKSL